jgi:C-terminal processing protease CtpA/Prc
MRLQIAIASALALGSTAAAQVAVATPRAPGARTIYPSLIIDQPRAVIGVNTSISAGARDTLGLLVSSVTRGSPAEKAGIEEGNRISMINGVNLKLAAADIGDPDMERLMSRRLTRELGKIKPGDEVNLSVYGNGQTRAIKVKTVDPDSLNELNRDGLLRRYEERATLGIGTASTGSKRDTLGVFVMSVDEEGPAAKAGIEEGARVAAINGVDLRVAREDAGDAFVSSTRMNRLNREMAKVKAGDAVELRVYQNGQTKTVKVTAVPARELSRGARGRIIHNGNGVTIIRSPDVVSMDVNGAELAATARRAAEVAARAAGDRLEDIGRILDEMGRGTGGTIRWLDETSDATAGPMMRQRTVIRM